MGPPRKKIELDGGVFKVGVWVKNWEDAFDEDEVEELLRSFSYLREKQPMSEYIVYQVCNKVFSLVFWTKEDAQEFLNTTTTLSGFTVTELKIFGKKPEGVK